MRVLVATRKTQGQREDDFSWTVDGELVRFPAALCDCPDCGCDRAMAGLSSSRATTTAMVVDNDDFEHEVFRAALRDTLVREGWVMEGDGASEDFVTSFALHHLAVAASFPPGTVVEIRNGELRSRAPS